MNLGVTVKELLFMCAEQMDKGNGNKHIIISRDDEGNGFHTLLYGFTTNREELESILEDDKEHTINNCIALG